MNKRQTLALRTEVLLGMIGQIQQGRAETLLTPLGFSRPQFAVLEHLSNSPKPRNTVVALSKQMQMSQPTVTRAVSVLADKGHLKLKSDPDDKRQTLITVTHKGLKHYSKAVESLLETTSEPYRDWQSSELEQVCSSLEKLYQWLDENR